GAKANQQALGAGELKVAIEVQSIGPFRASLFSQRAAVSQRIVKALNSRMKGAEHGEVGHPDGAGRQLKTVLERAGAEEAITKFNERRRSWRDGGGIDRRS